MSDLEIKRPKDFDLEQTLECGQCFHFTKVDEEEYVISAYGRGLHIAQKNNRLIFIDTDESDFNKVWRKYFDLDRDYAAIKKDLLKIDDSLYEAIETKWGVYILNQEFFETLISFIISQNKQIGHIKKIVADISAKYGNDLGEIARVKTYAFPTPFQMKDVTCEDLSKLKTGFRAGYIKDAIDRVIGKEFSKDYLDESFKEHFAGVSGDEAITELTKIKGVGLKVASCVALFSLGKRESFPVDVWIKRIMQDKYFDGKDTKIPDIKAFADERFGDLGGYAQQYLFYYARSLKSKK